MAYVREHGNQLAIVHGHRDAESGKVRQQVLFKICSRPEALAAIGERDGEGWQLRSLLEGRYRSIGFDWEKIKAGIKERMEVLPDIYPYRQAEMFNEFRDDLCAFTRQLGHSDPQASYAAAELVRGHRAELEYLRDLIDWRLAVCEQDETRWNGDNEFFWRRRTRAEDVPPEVIEEMSTLYLDSDLDRLEALARLFVDSYEDYADGHNYLGLVARERGQFDEAIEHFQRAIAEGRKLFPKRLPKKHYWVDHDTRPYVGGLQNLATTYHLAGRYDDAIDVCERLDGECGDKDFTTSTRAAIYLATNRWEDAKKAGSHLVGIWPWYSYIAAFASAEMGEPEAAVAWFLHGLLNSPRVGFILLDLPVPEPDSYGEAREHNIGVDLCEQLDAYLDQMPAALYEFFESVLDAPTTRALMAEKSQVDVRWRDERDASTRREELTSLPFAFRTAPNIHAEVSSADGK